ncbi:MAG TPA: NAD(P)(+) transhydrogenase (Re/Si-specific) subunit beta [Longimicrobiales bacterium]|nr:NAD(P)(+) transhydrogenase (Re/Si-specific) subunit beta [Longimicrobiales bacterium]
MSEVANGGALAFAPLLIEISYLVAAILFIVGLKRLSSPATARSGNILGATGMLVAVAATLLHWDIVSWLWIAVGILIGGVVGVVMARGVKMTGMPQMVALLNGFGGGASALVAGDEYLRFAAGSIDAPANVQATIMLSVLIGALTFSGSLVAFGKLQELITGRAVTYPGQKVVNGLIFGGTFALAAYLVAADANLPLYLVLAGASLLIGVLFVLPIGGADMPVVISLLNSFSGIAASMTGFVLGNNVLIISGALVGASGIILTKIMCDAMNRSLTNVLFGAFGANVTAGAAAGDAEGRSVRDISGEDAAILLGYARSVVFVPGYGMAVSQAQHQVRELADLLQSRGVDVKYAIHPVAGRMPGHMNVLLAEANVPYDQLIEMEQINPEFDRTDVAVVIGANDVVNPAARHDTASPIYGMPILDVDKAKTVIVMKRSMNPGFAGIENELFFADNTRMLFGDAKKSLTTLVQEVKAGV